MLLSSGIPKLDECLGGGFQPSSLALLAAGQAADPRVFAYQLIQANNVPAAYYSEQIGERELRADVSKYIFPQAQFSKMAFIGKKAGLSDAKKFKGSILVIDGYEDALYNYAVAAKAEGALVLCIVREEVMRPATDFDYAIRISAITRLGAAHSYFRVVKAPGTFKGDAVPYRAGFDGVAVYVPKIIITGPFHSGKSTFIHKVSTRAVSVNRMGTTIALDHGYVEHSGFSIDLFGTPGQERFEFMLDILRKDAFGVVLVVDSTKPETFNRAREMLEHVTKYNLPYIIAANKQDLPGAMKPEEVKRALVLEGDVVGTVATTGQGCIEALKRLVDKIISG
ncbi:MAG: GTP-binding protein [Candidatus Micrarchaeota archaeon]|nr:GTP-binding protein [Candidatus Micrarchaeota archaeon]